MLYRLRAVAASLRVHTMNSPTSVNATIYIALDHLPRIVFDMICLPPLLRRPPPPFQDFFYEIRYLFDGFFVVFVFACKLRRQTADSLKKKVHLRGACISKHCLELCLHLKFETIRGARFHIHYNANWP